MVLSEASAHFQTTIFSHRIKLSRIMTNTPQIVFTIERPTRRHPSAFQLSADLSNDLCNKLLNHLQTFPGYFQLSQLVARALPFDVLKMVLGGVVESHPSELVFRRVSRLPGKSKSLLIRTPPG
jgi:hypothetical protein